MLNRRPNRRVEARIADSMMTKGWDRSYISGMVMGGAIVPEKAA